MPFQGVFLLGLYNKVMHNLTILILKKGEKYYLENIGGEQGLYPPNKYFEEIKNWGWEELEKEQMGQAHFFTKGETIISVVIKEDYFHLYEMKEDFEFSH